MQRARWFLGQGPMGRANASLGNAAKLHRWILDRNRKMVVYSFGDLTAFDPSNTGPGGGQVNASSGNNEVWRGIFASDTPSWTKLQTQFGPASTGVVPSQPINASFSADPFQDDYIVMPGFFRIPSGNPHISAPILSTDGPGAVVSIAGTSGFGDNNPQTWTPTGFIFLFQRGTSVGGDQEIIQYDNRVVANDSSGTVRIVARRATGTTGGLGGWPTNTLVFQLGQNAYNDNLNPNGPIGDYGAYVMNPTIQGDGYAHWGYPAFAAPPSGYGGDDQACYAIMDWLPTSYASATKSTYRLYHSGGSGFLVQKLNRTALPGTWTETNQGQGLSFINEAMTASTPATITLTPAATDNILYPTTGGLLMIGNAGGGVGGLEAVLYSSKTAGGVFTISQRGASMLFQSGGNLSVRQNTTAQAHTGGGNVTKAMAPNAALSGFSCEKAQPTLDAYGRYIYFIVFKGGVEGMIFGPSAGFGVPHPYQPYVGQYDITTGRSQCVAPLPDVFNFGIGDQVPLDTGLGEVPLAFDPLNRVLVLPNQSNQFNGITDGWYLYHVDNPTAVYNLASAPGWELETGPYPSQGNELIWDDFRNCGLWIGSSANDSGVDTYYRYYGGPTTASTFINPVPVLTSISPASCTQGQSVTVTLTGSSFVGGSSARWDGIAQTTTFIDTNHLSFQVTTTLSAVVGDHAITVFNPTPGGGTSSASTFTVTTSSTPTPILTTLTPSSTLLNSAILVTVTGTNFVSTSIVNWDGAAQATTFFSSTTLTFSASGPLVAVLGAHSITVFNPGGGGLSNSLTFTVLPLAPSTQTGIFVGSVM